MPQTPGRFRLTPRLPKSPFYFLTSPLKQNYSPLEKAVKKIAAIQHCV